jgi:hypothetical protein
MLGFNPRGDEAVRRLVLKQEGHEIAWWVHNAQAVIEFCINKEIPLTVEKVGRRPA